MKPIIIADEVECLYLSECGPDVLVPVAFVCSMERRLAN